MDKYLFNDGTNVVKEVESKEELHTLLQAAADPGKVRIWVFNTSEWISYAAFLRQPGNGSPALPKTEKPAPAAKKEAPPPPPRRKKQGRLRKWGIAFAAIGLALLVYNFTKISWTKISSRTIIASRPENSPPVDVDSLIQTIETARGKKLDKLTATNFRIRNTWPDRLELRLDTDRDTSSEGLQYYNIRLSLDNSTGYNVDQAVAKITVWKAAKAVGTDTVLFDHISYTEPARRNLQKSYRGDSLSVDFTSIRAPAFNFCYSSDKKSNYGNLNDRWYCRD